MKFEILVRSCIVGEGLKATGACFACPMGTFLLIAPTVATECEACPKEKAFCLGGNNIGPKPGFWRSSEISDTFFECFEKEACLGMYPPDVGTFRNATLKQKAVGVCNTTAGYYGALCSGCLPGFKRQGLTKCKPCSEKYEIYFTGATLLVFVVALVLMVKLIIEGAEKEDMQSVFTKVMMNHL